MKNASARTTSADHNDWERVRAMTDADICFDGDSPHTFEEDWDGATMKYNGEPLGNVVAA